ncbi:MAG: hypothetical protein WCO94_15250, partial [Verrucomicrobiota bacterium]
MKLTNKFKYEQYFGVIIFRSALPMKIRLLLASILLSIPVSASENQPSGADHFKVTDEVLQKSPPNFSTNFGFGGFAPWNPDMKVNVWNTPFTSGPIQFQHHGRADA